MEPGPCPEGHCSAIELVLLPVADTHGAHKAASLLALEAVQQLSPKAEKIRDSRGALESTNQGCRSG